MGNKVQAITKMMVVCTSGSFGYNSSWNLTLTEQALKDSVLLVYSQSKDQEIPLSRFQG